MQSIFSAALRKAKLRSIFSKSGKTFTVFAPSDKALEEAFTGTRLICVHDFQKSRPCTSTADLLSSSNLETILLNSGKDLFAVERSYTRKYRRENILICSVICWNSGWGIVPDKRPKRWRAYSICQQLGWTGSSLCRDSSYKTLQFVYLTPSLRICVGRHVLFDLWMISKWSQIHKTETSTFIGNAKVSAADLLAVNGYLHVVDNVVGSTNPWTMHPSDVSVNATAIHFTSKVIDADIFDQEGVRVST